MNTKTLEWWKAEARRRQATARVKQQGRRVRRQWLTTRAGLRQLERKVGGRLMKLVKVEEVKFPDAHIMDVDECGQW